MTSEGAVHLRKVLLYTLAIKYEVSSHRRHEPKIQVIYEEVALALVNTTKTSVEEKSGASCRTKEAKDLARSFGKLLFTPALVLGRPALLFLER